MTERRSVPRRTRIVLVDDHPAIAEAIAGRIGDSTDLEVAGTAEDVDAAVALIERTKPDVVVTDVRLGGQDSGLSLLGRFRGPPPAFLVLSSFDYPAFYSAAFDGGAAGYLLKSASLDEILRAIRAVAVGGTWFSASALQAARRAERLPSDRELQLIRLVAAGRSNDEIAADLGLSVKTVESHLRRLFARYGVLSRTELAMLAVRQGWIPGHD
jgi:DNA-binding NarL/FixJ family response regulator